MDKLPRFRDLTLILGHGCNLRCGYCYVPKDGRVLDENLALSTASQFLDRAPQHGRISLSFFGGEPFLFRPLMERVMDLAVQRRPQVSFSAPTNGLLLDTEALELVRRRRLRLALSIDGVTPASDRRGPNGEGTAETLRPLASALSGQNPILRMTVTPRNVCDLAENIITLHSWGFSRIMHQPALEEPWPAQAIAVWLEQHRLLADWACDEYAAGRTLPELVVLEGITARLGGQGMRGCGAGVTQAAVDPDGRVFACFRAAFGPGAEERVLGHVDGGVNEVLLRAHAMLDPRRARPETGSCRSCPGRDGCTVYCPAMGALRLGDLRGVPADACELMRIQVEVCKELRRRMRAIAGQARRRVTMQVAAAAAALALGQTACGDERGPVSADAGQADGTLKVDSLGHDGQQKMDGMIPGLCPRPDKGLGHDMPIQKDLIGPGVCPFKPDMPIQKDLVGPGVCPFKPDMPVKKDIMGPGLCPFKPDGLIGPGVCPTFLDKGPALDGPIPGECPIKVDSSIGPGLCPFLPDTGPPKKDGPQPGVCPFKPEAGTKKDAGPGPGLCPMPGVC